ncbi:RCC1 domain-containing protein [Photobacterium kasasachensis]|uniref:RCC1 domain-containing protein n=1 Tax=Photobacterium kasasachensis TaxID=2910240 RepID=UPI003D10BCA6
MYRNVFVLIVVAIICGCKSSDPSDPKVSSDVGINYSDHVSVTGKQVCSVIDKKLSCAGSNVMSGTLISLPEPPNSEGVELVSVGSHHACEIVSDSVKCWGKNYNGELNSPLFFKPYIVASGESFSCAAGSAGLDCWGYQGGSYCSDSSCSNMITINNPTSNPPLNNISDLSLSGFYGCAISNGQGHCWGHASYGQTSIPTLDNPTQITTGDYHACALTSNGVHCWGYGDLNKNIPQDFQPISISAGRGFTCGIDSNSVKCWGEANVTGSIYGPPIFEQPLSNPISVSAGSDLVCIIDDQGQACYGDTSHL